MQKKTKLDSSIKTHAVIKSKEEMTTKMKNK